MGTSKLNTIGTSQRVVHSTVINARHCHAMLRCCIHQIYAIAPTRGKMNAKLSYNVSLSTFILLSSLSSCVSSSIKRKRGIHAVTNTEELKSLYRSDAPSATATAARTSRPWYSIGSSWYGLFHFLIRTRSENLKVFHKIVHIHHLTLHKFEWARQVGDRYQKNFASGYA